jgi:hypothetical protein
MDNTRVALAHGAKMIEKAEFTAVNEPLVYISGEIIFNEVSASAAILR